jgi:hypothetical protein
MCARRSLVHVGRNTSRGLDAQAVCALACMRKTGGDIQLLRARINTGATGTTWLWLERAWDETPLELRSAALHYMIPCQTVVHLDRMSSLREHNGRCCLIDVHTHSPEHV